MILQRLSWAILVVLALAAAGMAYPNLNATTGLVAAPTGQTVANGAFQGAADILFFDETTVNIRAIYGLTDRFEVGAAIILGDNASFGVTGKYRLPMAANVGDWAMGLSFGDTENGGSGYQAFIVATRAMTGEEMNNVRLVGSLGVSFTNFDESSGFRPFVGAQLLLPQAFEIDGEFILEAGDFTESIFSLALRKQFAGGFTGEIGLTNATGFVGSSDSNLFLGASYNFVSP